MTGVTLSLTFEEHGIAGGLANIAAMGRNPEPVLEKVGLYGENSTRERFDTNVGPDGVPWKKSLHSVITGQPTLVGETLQLRDEIHYSVEDGGVEWGSSLEYAAIHQFGGVIQAKSGKGLSFMLASGDHVVVQSVTMPARPYLGLSAEDDAEILSIVQRAELAAFQGVGA